MSETYRERIRELIEPVLAAQGLEVVDLECLRMKTRWLVRLYLDREQGGVTLEDCTAVSHEIGDLLNVHDLPPGPYTLEVSSPGLDRPLTRDKDFERYRGSRVRIRTREPIEGQRNFAGTLADYAIDGEQRTVILETEGKSVRLERENIQKANLEYESEATGIRQQASGKKKKK